MKFKKSTLYLLILLPGLFVSDILYGFLELSQIQLPISPGVIIRGGLFIIAIYISFQYKKYIDNIIYIIVWSFVVFAMPGFIQSTVNGFMIQELMFLTKLLYGPFVFLMFIILICRGILKKEQVLQFIEYTAYFVGGSLFVMQFLQFGFSTYEEYTGTTGQKGLFHAQNDISLALTLAYCVAIYRSILYPRLIALPLLAITSFALLGIGTRSSMAALVLVPVFTFLVMFIARSNQWGVKKKVRFLIIFLPVFVLFSGFAVLKGYEEIIDSNYQVDKYERIMEGELPREVLINAGLTAITERDMLQNVFGEGAVPYFRNVYSLFHQRLSTSTRRVEVDWIELLGAYGIIFTLLVHVSLLVALIYTIKLFFSEKNPELGIIIIMFALYLGHSILAGHAIVSPIVNTIMAAILGIIFTYKKQIAKSEK